jgi:hypothetical protein
MAAGSNLEWPPFFWRERGVANQNGLRLIGWAYGGLALTVAVVAFIVVSAQINDQVQARVDGQVEARAETQAFRLPN